MKPLMMALALGLAAAGLVACDTYDRGYRGTGISGSSSSAPYGTYDSRYGYDRTYSSSSVRAACDPRNVPSSQRATILHQDRPGGSDCPDAVTAPVR